MTDSLDLLRMLEPTVRPDGVTGSKATGPRPPIESESFERLLQEAQAMQEDTMVQQREESPMRAESVASSSQAMEGRLLPGLTGFEQVENASLRELLERGGGIA